MIKLESWQIIVLIGLVVILFAKLFAKNEQTKLKEQLIEEMEDTFEHFALEMEEENKQVLEHILSVKEQYVGENSKLLSRIEYLEKQFIETTVEYRSAIEKSSAAIEAAKHVQAKPKDEEQPQSEIKIEEEKSPEPTFEMDIKERYHDVFHLHNQGKSIEYISKKLGINKGEVQLIIQLSKQEEQSGV